jgi:hypothetical protein
MNNFSEKVGFIWSVADLLRGDYKQSDYGKVILPLTVLRRLDCGQAPEPQRLAAPRSSSGPLAVPIFREEGPPKRRWEG